eukprot:GHVU01065320.1.p1 GENE.GHVU01065320.1~~GHVU01065320.1.p1  ORF type:complete len:279 (+),score=23.43 GHVU01065320.1:229-1065(+)
MTNSTTAGEHHCWCDFCFDKLQGGARTDRKPRSECSSFCGDFRCGNDKDTRMSVYTSRRHDHEPGPASYVGCWEDKPTIKADLEHRGPQRYSGFIPLAADCWEYCRGRGYAYAGIQNGEGCFCGNSSRSSYGYGKYGYHRKQDSICKTNVDIRDHSTPLGGYEASAVFFLSATHVGCFEDHGGKHYREYAHAPISDAYYNSLSVDLCVGYCKSRGYNYAAMQNGTQCFCGYESPRYKQLSQSACSKPCSGNPNERCGGAQANSVWLIGSSRYSERCES